MNKSYNRIFYLDLMKTLAIAMVVSLHSGLWHTNFIANSTFATYSQYFLRLIMEGVPIFILVNGYLKLSKPFNFKKHLDKILKLFIIYIVWSFILTILLSLINKDSISFKYLIESVMLTDSFKYTGILWFVRYLILLYFIFPIIKYIYDNNYSLFKYLFIVLVVFTFGFNFLYLIIDLINYKNAISILASFRVFINSFSIRIVDNIYLLYFMLGGIVYNEKDKICNNKALILGVISWAFAFAYGVIMSKINNTLYTDNYNYGQMMLMFTILGFLFIFTKLNIKNKYIKNAIISVSDNSMGIYLIHTVIIALINLIFPFCEYGLLVRALSTLIIVILSWLLAIILRKIPLVNKLIKI